ncbi:MAG: hypothetical protein WC734_05880 [Patescibacteria group bacterium]|jgi:hypothetical protein
MAEFVSLASINATSIQTYLNDTTISADLINAHLLGARSFVEEYCRHDFLSTTRTAEKPLIDKNTSVFYLKNWPVASITSLVENGNTLVEDTDFYIDKDTGRVEKIASTDILNPDRDVSYWSTERAAVVVTYVGGEAITDDVIMAVKEIAAIRAGVKRRTYTDGEGVERATTMNSIPKDIMDVLNRHRHRQYIL